MDPAKNEVGFGSLRTSEKSSMTLDNPKSVILACPFWSIKMLLYKPTGFVRFISASCVYTYRLSGGDSAYPFEVSVDDGWFEVV